MEIYVAAGRGSFAVITGFVAYGLLLSLAWMALGAPDVALTEAALGGGVTGALLLKAHSRLRGAKAEQDSVGILGRAAAVIVLWRFGVPDHCRPDAPDSCSDASTGGT